MGDRRAQADARSKPLLHFLRLGFLARFSILIIERVSEALTCPWFQSVLKEFCQRTHYWLQQGILNLQDVWPARRKRFWATLTHPFLGRCTWDDLPTVVPTPVVAHVLDAFADCTPTELQQLVLDVYELRRFGEVGYETNQLQWNKKMQTSLHSCGCQLSSCPCGCRQYPFSEERLSKGGLHGILVPLPGESHCGTRTYPNRHVHPDELALLNGVRPGQPWGGQMKLALCGLGQLASPLQAGRSSHCPTSRTPRAGAKLPNQAHRNPLGCYDMAAQV